jgi:hypothetical protein
MYVCLVNIGPQQQNRFTLKAILETTKKKTSCAFFFWPIAGPLCDSAIVSLSSPSFTGEEVAVK